MNINEILPPSNSVYQKARVGEWGEYKQERKDLEANEKLQDGKEK